MNKTKLAREGRLPEYLSIQRDIIYNTLRYLDKKVTKETFEVLLFYLGIEDQRHFHVFEEINTGTTTNQETSANEEPAGTTVTLSQLTEALEEPAESPTEDTSTM